MSTSTDFHPLKTFLLQIKIVRIIFATLTVLKPHPAHLFSRLAIHMSELARSDPSKAHPGSWLLAHACVQHLNLYCLTFTFVSNTFSREKSPPSHGSRKEMYKWWKDAIYPGVYRQVVRKVNM